MAPAEFCDVAVQMVRAQLMEGADDPTLEIEPQGLDRVSGVVFEDIPVSTDGTYRQDNKPGDRIQGATAPAMPGRRRSSRNGTSSARWAQSAGSRRSLKEETMKRIMVPLVMCLMLASGAVVKNTDTADARDSQPGCGYSFVAENDVLLADRNYTHGFLLSRSCVRPMVSDSADSELLKEIEIADRPWITRLRDWNIDRLNDAIELFGLSKNKNKHRVYSHYGGLSLYTPNELTKPPSSTADGRPYASLLLYGDSVLHANDTFAIKKEAQVGLMGIPIGGDIQDALHEVIGGDDPQGWEDEISRGGEPVLAAALQGKWLLWSADEMAPYDKGPYDLTASLGGSVGYYTAMRLGLSGRLGIIDSPFWGDYGTVIERLMAIPLALPPGSVTASNTDGQSKIGNSKRSNELYFFANAGLDWVLYSAVLQGQFRENEYDLDSSEVKNAVLSATLGVAMRFGEFRLSLSHSFRGPEIEGGKSHRWSSLSIGRAF